MSWDLDKKTRVFIQFAIRVSGLKCLCLSMVRMIDAGTSTCVRLFTTLFVSSLQHNPVFIWYHTNKYWQYLAILSLTMNNNSTLNSHSSAHYMNRWLSITRSSFMTVIHCYDSQLSLTTFLTFLFTLSFQLVNALDVWVLTCPSLHVHSPVHAPVCGHIAPLFHRLFICLLYALAPFTFNIWRCHSHILTLQHIHSTMSSRWWSMLYSFYAFTYWCDSVCVVNAVLDVIFRWDGEWGCTFRVHQCWCPDNNNHRQ